MLIVQDGDLFDFECDAYAHGVNTLGRMHAGVAVEFRVRYPEMFRQYRRQCHKGELKGGDVFFWPGETGKPAVFNLVTQDTLKHANRSFLHYSFKSMLYIARRKDISRIVMPCIGCGFGKLGKGDLLEASLPIIEATDVTLSLCERGSDGRG